MWAIGSPSPPFKVSCVAEKIEVMDRDLLGCAGMEVTLLKFNMEPENQSLEKEIPIGNHPFLGSMLNLGRVVNG